METVPDGSNYSSDFFVQKTYHFCAKNIINMSKKWGHAYHFCVKNIITMSKKWGHAFCSRTRKH